MEEALALEQENLEQDNLEQQQKRALAADKKQGGVSQAKDEAVEKLKKEAELLARRATLRFINSAFAATVVGLIVTYIIMSVQAVAGNFFGSKIIPPLSMLELGIWLLASILIMLIIVAAMSLLAFIMAPLIDPSFIPKLVFKTVVNFFGLD